MRQFLSGAALAALLAAGLPAAAQTGGTAQPNTPPASASQPTPAAPAHRDMSSNPGRTGASQASDAAGEPRTKAKSKHAAKHRSLARRKASSSPNDNVAEALNRQELAKIQQASTRMPGHNIGEAPAQPGPSGAGMAPKP
jgi:hypothetical protein